MWFFSSFSVNTVDDDLRRSLAEAIAYCCEWSSNKEEFGKLGAIEPLVGYMASKDIRVHRSTALALYHLSYHSMNCITMHQVLDLWTAWKLNFFFNEFFVVLVNCCFRKNRNCNDASYASCVICLTLPNVVYVKQSNDTISILVVIKEI